MDERVMKPIFLGRPSHNDTSAGVTLWPWPQYSHPRFRVHAHRMTNSYRLTHFWHKCALAKRAAGFHWPHKSYAPASLVSISWHVGGEHVDLPAEITSKQKPYWLKCAWKHGRMSARCLCVCCSCLLFSPLLKETIMLAIKHRWWSL